MTPFGILGCMLLFGHRRVPAFACLYMYSEMGLPVVGHYHIAAPWKVSFKINLLITLEAVSALLLGLYTLWFRFWSTSVLPRHAA